MNSKARVPDRLKRSVQAMSDRSFSAQLVHFLSPDTAEELARRRAHLLALLLVAVISSAKHVTGLTDGSAQYTMYGLAIAVAGAVGGIAPALVATMGAVLLANAASASVFSVTGLAFVLEGLCLALVVGGVAQRLRTTAARLAAANTANEALSEELRRARVSHDAFTHLEEMASDSAVFVVNAHGLIIEWPPSAARMYGFDAEQMLGSNPELVFGGSWAQIRADYLLTEEDRGEPACRGGVHRRADGSPVHVELAIRRHMLQGRQHFTIAVHDLARRRETDAFREAALRAQTTLQHDADTARAQLETLEALTDPSISVVGGTATIDELLDRLRSAMRAEGIALVQVGRSATRVVAAAGLRPLGGGMSGPSANTGTGDNRVALVHNDPVRVAQVSALQWPPTVSSIVVVPVCQTGSISFRIEVVNERRAPATEWDLALARIVADRLASAMRHRTPADSTNAVA